MDMDSGVLRAEARGRRRRNVADALAVLLLGVGGSWSAGNVGPVVGEVSEEFGISLASVGILSGTILFTAMVAGLLVAPHVAERLGLTRALALAAAVGGAGSLVFAAADSFTVAAIGRVMAGVGLGFVGGLAPVLARLTGGVGRVGLFGAAFQLGIGLGVGVGSVLADADVSWRVGFLITAGVAFSGIPLVLGEHLPAQRREPQRGFVGAAVRSGGAWRLSLLFMAMFAVPLTLGSWFVHYVTVDGTLSASLAGALAFLLFGLSALMRRLGGGLAGRGVPQPLLTGAMPLLATAGLALLALDVNAGAVAAAVLLMGVGFALPYATMMLEAQKLLPAEPARPTSLLTLLGTAVAIPIVPVLGGILDAGEGELAFLALGLFVAVAAILNVRPAGAALELRR
jgi:predicted MFS family arabinose efflux permease